jgi:hypothetical protein
VLVNFLVGWGLLAVAGAVAWVRVHRTICIEESLDETLCIDEHVDKTLSSRDLGPITQRNALPGEAA